MCRRRESYCSGAGPISEGEFSGLLCPTAGGLGGIGSNPCGLERWEPSDDACGGNCDAGWTCCPVGEEAFFSCVYDNCAGTSGCATVCCPDGAELATFLCPETLETRVILRCEL